MQWSGGLTFGSGFTAEFPPKPVVPKRFLWDVSNGTISLPTVRGNAVLDETGAMYIIGSTSSYGLGIVSMVVMKISADGATIEWQKVIGTTSSSEDGSDLAIGDGTDLYVCGKINNIPYVAKLNRNTGSPDWERTADSTSDIGGFNGCSFYDGNLYLVGDWRVSGTARPCFVKISSAGTVQWSKYSTSSTSGFDRVYADAAGAYCVGQRNSSGSLSANMQVLNLSTGAISYQAQQSINTSGQENAYGVIKASNGTAFYISGRYQFSGNNLQRATVSKLGTNQTTIWSRQIYDSSNTFAYDVSEDPNTGNVLVALSGNSANAILELDSSDGTILTARRAYLNRGVLGVGVFNNNRLLLRNDANEIESTDLGQWRTFLSDDTSFKSTLFQSTVTSWSFASWMNQLDQPNTLISTTATYTDSSFSVDRTVIEQP